EPWRSALGLPTLETNIQEVFMTNAMAAIDALGQLLAKDEPLRKQLAAVSSPEAIADLLATVARRRRINITYHEILSQLKAFGPQGLDYHGALTS
ncbi:MAG: hypothetical protein WBA83_03200, partial [Burkholderiaceae bacterium]